MLSAPGEAPPGRPAALITGASAGLGEALARVAAAEGFDTWLVARTEARLRALAAELRKEHGVEARPLPLDLTREDAAERVLEAVGGPEGAPEVLVNNAGIGTWAAFHETPGEATERLLRLDVLAPTRLMRAFLPAMVARGRGRVLNVASTAGFQPGPYMASYYASKAYVLHLSEAVAHEVRGSGVTVTALCPGPTRTEFHERADMEEVGLLRWLVVMDAAPVARRGWEAAMAGRRVVVPGLMNKLGVFVLRFIPRGLAAWTVAALQRPPTLGAGERR